MKFRIYGGLCFLLLLIATTAQKDPVKVIYYVEHEVEQENDFIQITLEIKASSRTLLDALTSAKKTAESVAELGKSYCQQTSKNPKKECEDATQISQFQIEPQYKMVRKQATFQAFVVKHEVTIKVLDTESIGILADSFLKYQDLTIIGFEWQPLQEVDSEEAAIKQGISSGDGYCKQFGLSFGSIQHVEEIMQEQEEDGEQQEEEEEAEEEPEIVTYKFEIECIPTVKKTKGK